MVHLLTTVLQVTGIRDQETSGQWYAFWSGIGGDLPVIGGVIALYYKHSCHYSGCHRIGKHAYQGTPYCTKHHPELAENPQKR